MKALSLRLPAPRTAAGLLIVAWAVGCADDILPPGHAELRKSLAENGNAAIGGAGGKITVVSLRDAGVRDIRPLAGLPLEALDLHGVPVSDLGPLRGMPLEELWLQGTLVSDLSPLVGMRLRRLGLADAPVSDLSPLATFRQLRQLNIAGTGATDLSPLAGLPLREFVFTPARIATGLEAIREMTSLEAIGISRRAEDLLAPAEFWRRHDAGEFSDDGPRP